MKLAALCAVCLSRWRMEVGGWKVKGQAEMYERRVNVSENPFLLFPFRYFYSRGCRELIRNIK